MQKRTLGNQGLEVSALGFGCMGLGVYWFAWACGFAGVGALGLWAANRSRRAGWGQRAVRGAGWAQGLAGLGLLLRWMVG